MNPGKPESVFCVRETYPTDPVWPPITSLPHPPIRQPPKKAVRKRGSWRDGSVRRTVMEVMDADGGRGWILLVALSLFTPLLAVALKLARALPGTRQTNHDGGHQP